MFCPYLPVLTAISVCNSHEVKITDDNLIRGLGPKLNESTSKVDTMSSITGSPINLTDGSKSSPSVGNLENIDTEVSLYLSSAASCQASASGANPKELDLESINP
ncbi:hypothetical protein AYI68_g8310 [Smittium mucronatum]|uniref:Uncharacterized protein n=1 Tax=Smittium mucronatum TaxID=133383 RepID=A0A1R0GL99_9FUNG|nr:hypothetical protein AYI68_g8386 [Smittium mucronatum]OLY77658.1 hypothetical protein AYI68_g8310 [Smittium mucronatum]